MDILGGERNSGKKRRVADEPEFQELRRLLDQMPAERQDAVLDHLKHEHDESTTEETQDTERGDSAGDREVREDSVPDQPGDGS